MLVLLLFTSFFWINVKAQESERYFYHTVEKGQNLYSISSMYGIERTDIMKLNPGCETRVTAGKVLRIPQSKNSHQEQIFHTIQPGETLYGLTVRYKLSAQKLCEANPGLSASTFQIGKVIYIPDGEVTPVPKPKAQTSIQPAVTSNCREMHRVKRKETIYSVSRMYEVSEEALKAANPELRQGMKKGDLLCIPYSVSLNSTPKQIVAVPSNKELFSSVQSNRRKNYSTLHVAIMLPFLLERSTLNSESSRMMEYYEGMLIAVDSLKKAGVSIDLHIYDTGDESSSLQPLLAKEELKRMDIIFGPYHSSHISTLSAFAKKNNIRLVIPFSSKDNSVFNTPQVYQINTPQSYLYSEVFNHFVQCFSEHNIILVDVEGDHNKKDFIKELKEELSSKGITTRTASAQIESLTAALSTTKPNLFIANSGTNSTLNKLLPLLVLTVREHPENEISLFGYPEYQTYTKDHLNSFFEVDTYFYSSFYTNNLLPAPRSFSKTYNRWYGKTMANTYPRYGMLGFDTAYFFLKGLSLYGSDFEEKNQQLNISSIQTGFKFERVNTWGGFINRKVFFVHYSKEFEVIKMDFDKQ